jgi:putative glutamine amidotransferase
VSRAAPWIGITMYGPDGEPPAVSLPVAYVDAVRMAGGVPVLLAPGSAPPATLLEDLDALVLAGGGDLDPDVWGGERHPAVYGVVRARDAFELELARTVLERAELPLLAICRGMQVLNVALGGDLEVHVPDVRGETVRHRLPPREPTFHPVRIEPGGTLERIYGRLEFPVCSWHHQEVRKLGHGLHPCAWAEDGVIEALVLPDRPWVVAVQWHPEMQVRDDPLQRRLFEALVEAARS